jgi:hypothetical protein
VGFATKDPTVPLAFCGAFGFCGAFSFGCNNLVAGIFL